jgi:hypothetical protein
MNYRPFQNLRRSPLALLVIAVGIAGVTACESPTGPTATQPTSTSTVVVYALSGTPLGTPSAYSIPANQAVRIDGNLLFDVAFDIDAQGRLVVYQMELVTLPTSGIHRVGLLRVDEPFDDIERAPGGEYDFESPLVAQQGDVIVIESHEVRVCGYPFSPRLYAKFEVLDIDSAARSARLRVTQNPNCGFRSFREGVPTD